MTSVLWIDLSGKMSHLANVFHLLCLGFHSFLPFVALPASHSFVLPSSSDQRQFVLWNGTPMRRRPSWRNRGFKEAPPSRRPFYSGGRKWQWTGKDWRHSACGQMPGVILSRHESLSVWRGVGLVRAEAVLDVASFSLRVKDRDAQKQRWSYYWLVITPFKVT